MKTKTAPLSEINLLKKDIQNRLNSIRIISHDLSVRKYGVTIKYYSNNDEQTSKRIDYESDVTLKINNGIGEVAVNKYNIFYNQHEPDLLNEIFANAISKSLYPVKTLLNEKGIGGSEILNQNEIIERWKNEKSKLSEKYKSEDFDEFLKKVDEKMNNKLQLEKSIHHDWFWNLFFHPKLINYGDKRTKEMDLYLSVIPYQSPVRFFGSQKIEKIPTDYHSFVINFESVETSAPKYFYPKNSIENQALFMTLKVNYDLDLYHHFPMHTRAHFEVFTKNWKGDKEIIKKIDFTMYQTNSEDYKNKKLSNESAFITGGLVKLPPNKWGFDNYEKLENDW